MKPLSSPLIVAPTQPGASSGFPPPLIAQVGRSIGGGAAPSIRVQVLDLSIARDEYKISFGGVFLWAIASSSSGATTTVKFNEPAGSGVPLQRGLVIGGIPFDEIYITHAAQGAGVTLTLLASMTILDVTNAQALASLVSIETANARTPTVVTVGAAATATLPLRATRKGAVILAADANTETVWLGDAGVTVGNGFPLKAGASVTVEGQPAMLSIRNAVAQTLYVLDEYTT